MFRFLLGVAIGFIAARMVRPQTISTKKFEEGFSDIQKRAEAVLIESRRILEETRNELGAAMEASRTSVQQKAVRLQKAATEPETVVSQEGGTTSEGEKESHTIQESQRMPRPSDIE